MDILTEAEERARQAVSEAIRIRRREARASRRAH